MSWSKQTSTKPNEQTFSLSHQVQSIVVPHASPNLEPPTQSPLKREARYLGGNVPELYHITYDYYKI